MDFVEVQMCDLKPGMTILGEFDNRTVVTGYPEEHIFDGTRLVFIATEHGALAQQYNHVVVTI